jgi:hypothetical protein
MQEHRLSNNLHFKLVSVRQTRRMAAAALRDRGLLSAKM